MKFIQFLLLEMFLIHGSYYNNRVYFLSRRVLGYSIMGEIVNLTG